MLDARSAERFARTLHIDGFTVRREYLQLLFLKYFYGQKRSEKIFFKGGTALRFLFGSFRFSEDLDFTSLVSSEHQLRRVIEKTLQALAQEVGDVTFKRSKTVANSFSGRIFQHFKEFRFPLSIRLDFSLREKPVHVETSYVETVFPVGPYPQVSHLESGEIVAEKIRALLTRVKGRDLFDLWFMLSKNVAIDWPLVNQKMAFYHKKTKLEQLAEVIERIPQKELKDDLTKFLPLTHRGLVVTLKEMTLGKLKKPLL